MDAYICICKRMRARIRIFSVYSARAQTHMCTHARVSACTHVYMHVGPYTCDSQKHMQSAPQFPKSHRWGSRNIAEVTMEMHKRHPKTKMHISMGWNQTITMVCIPYHGTATVSKKQAIPHPRKMQLRHTGMKNVIQAWYNPKKRKCQ